MSHYKVLTTESLTFVTASKGKKRKTPVSIIIEKMVCQGASPAFFERPVHVEGVIEVMETKGRDNAPEPLSGFSVSQSARGFNYQYGSLRNTGRTDMHKGHIMALELGGPDVAFNIIPQWAMFQSNGAWRQFEIKARDLAQRQKTRPLTFVAQLLYLNSTYKRSSTPIGVYVEIRDGSKVLLEFAREQKQDVTDQMLLLRQVKKSNNNKIEMEGYTSDSKGKLKRKKPGQMKPGEKEFLEIHEKPLETKRLKMSPRPVPVLQAGIFKGKLNKKTQKQRVERGLLELKRSAHFKPFVPVLDSESDSDYIDSDASDDSMSE